MELFDLKIMASDHVFYNGKAQVLTIHTLMVVNNFLHIMPRQSMRLRRGF